MYTIYYKKEKYAKGKDRSLAQGRGKDQTDPMKRLRFFLRYLRRHWLAYSLGAWAIFLTNWLSVVIPQHIQGSIDLLMEGKLSLAPQAAQLEHHLLMILGLALVIIVVRSMSRVLFFNPGRAIEYEVKNDLFIQLTALQKEYYDQNPVGNIVSRLQNDITGMRLLCGFVLMQVFNIATALSITPYMMWQLSPELTLYCVLPIGLAFVAVRVGMGVVVGHSRVRQEQLQGLSGFLLSSLAGIDVLRGFQLQAWSMQNFSQKNQAFLQKSLQISLVRSFLMPVLGNLENLLKVLILFVGGFFVLEGRLTLGELTAFMTYAALLTMPLTGLGWVSTIFQQSMVGVESLETILDQPTLHRQRPATGLAPRELFGQGLKVQNLTFAYPDSATPMLQGVSFTLRPGQMIGVLGAIGSGKTTLVNCLNGYLSLPPGLITLGGRDLQSLPHGELRSAIRTVSQDVFLFSDSVENNIRFGQGETELDQAQLEELVVEAALAEEVERFPAGINTLVGEKGIMLSGGQKQRIALARAFAEPVPLLILDNVLSAVDQATERFLIERILTHKDRQALLIVSHRVAALERADEILVLDQGCIVERGTHKTLMALGGIYAQTWKLQQGGSHE